MKEQIRIMCDMSGVSYNNEFINFVYNKNIKLFSREMIRTLRKEWDYICPRCYGKKEEKDKICYKCITKQKIKEFEDYWRDNMYIKLTEEERTKLNRVMEITYTYYDVEGNYIKGDDLWTALEDLLIYYEGLEEQFEDFKQNVEDNYKKIPYEDQI